MEQFAAMGANRIERERLLPICMTRAATLSARTILPRLYRFCSGLKESMYWRYPQGLIQRHGGIRYEKQLHNGVEI